MIHLENPYIKAAEHVIHRLKDIQRELGAHDEAYAELEDRIIGARLVLQAFMDITKEEPIRFRMSTFETRSQTITSTLQYITMYNISAHIGGVVSSETVKIDDELINKNYSSPEERIGAIRELEAKYKIVRVAK